jgi:DNA-binding GntR family transcriptional regulator
MERLFHFALASSDRDNEMRHEHHDLVDAISAGDGMKAERIAGEQIRSAQKMVIDAMISGAQFEMVNLAAAPMEKPC